MRVERASKTNDPLAAFINHQQIALGREGEGGDSVDASRAGHERAQIQPCGRDAPDVAGAVHGHEVVAIWPNLHTRRRVGRIAVTLVVQSTERIFQHGRVTPRLWLEDRQAVIQ